MGIIDDAPIWNAFRQGLRDLGYLEGQNIAFEYRYADGVPDRLDEAAAELVRRQVAVILAVGGVPPSLAAKAPTAKRSESPGRIGVTTSPVSQKMMRNSRPYNHGPSNSARPFK